MSAIRRVAVTNVFGPLNRGDFELFQQLLEVLREGGAVDVHAIARDPERCREHFGDVTFHPQPGVAPDTGGRIGRLLAAGRTGILFLAARLPIFERLLPARQRTALAAIRDADLVIACPGGYLTSSSWSYFPQLAQLEYAVRRGPRTWLAPMSIGPAHGRLHRFLLRQTLRRAERVYVRESWSERFCEDLGVASTRSADLAFRPAERWLARRAEGGAQRYITATVVRWDFPGEPDPALLRERYHGALAETLNQVAARWQLPVKLLLQVDNDRGVTEAVAAKLKVDHEIIHVTTPDENREILSSSRLMIGSRFHSAVFSMTVGCPTVVVSYLPKARYMMEDMGLGLLSHDIGKVTADGLIRSIGLIDTAGAQLRERARDAILRQGCADQNPFVAALHSAMRGEERGAHA